MFCRCVMWTFQGNAVLCKLYWFNDYTNYVKWWDRILGPLFGLWRVETVETLVPSLFYLLVWLSTMSCRLPLYSALTWKTLLSLHLTRYLRMQLMHKGSGDFDTSINVSIVDRSFDIKLYMWFRNLYFV